MLDSQTPGRTRTLFLSCVFKALLLGALATVHARCSPSLAGNLLPARVWGRATLADLR